MKKLVRLADRVHRFFGRPRSQKYILAEAYLCLFWARMAVLSLPFKWIATWCGEQGLEMEQEPMPKGPMGEIRWSIVTASRYAWWNSKCLTQALAAKSMLRRRGLRSTMYLGLSQPGAGDFAAHAWLRCGCTVLTGGEEMVNFTVVAKFTEPCGPEASDAFG